MIERKSGIYLIITFIMLTIRPFYNCIESIFQFTGIAFSLKMIYMYLLLWFFFAAILFKYKLPLKKLLWYLGILAFYGISYLWTTPEARQYFNNTDIIAVLFVFAPIACICTTQVSSWEPLFNENRYLFFTDGVIVLSLLSKIAHLNETVYMSFSYMLLPLWGICLISAFVYGHRLQWVFLMTGVLEGLLYGARAPLLWLFALAVFTWFVISANNIRNKKMPAVLPVLLLIIISLAAVRYLIPTLLQSSYLDTSYILKRIYAGTASISKPREVLFTACRREIAKLGFSVNGLFYDRTVLPNAQYAHNIVYEVLISLGWIFGIPFLVVTFWYIVRSVFNVNNTGKIFTGYFICTLFLRYLLSGSIFDETDFVVCLSALYSVRMSYSKAAAKEEFDWAR